MKRDKLIKFFFGNRKLRKRNKMAHRSNLAFWDETGDPYKGEQREILEIACKSSSMETRRIWLDRTIDLDKRWLDEHGYEYDYEIKLYQKEHDTIKRLLKSRKQQWHFKKDDDA